MEVRFSTWLIVNAQKGLLIPFCINGGFMATAYPPLLRLGLELRLGLGLWEVG